MKYGEKQGRTKDMYVTWVAGIMFFSLSSQGGKFHWQGSVDFMPWRKYK